MSDENRTNHMELVKAVTVYQPTWRDFDQFVAGPCFLTEADARAYIEVITSEPDAQQPRLWEVEEIDLMPAGVRYQIVYHTTMSVYVVSDEKGTRIDHTAWLYTYPHMRETTDKVSAEVKIVTPPAIAGKTMLSLSAVGTDKTETEARVRTAYSEHMKKVLVES